MMMTTELMTPDRAIPNYGRPAAQEPLLVEPHDAAGPPHEVAVIEEAANAYRPVKRAARSPFRRGSRTLVIGAAAALFTLVWPSFASAYITVGVLAVGTVEFMGSRKLRQADPKAPRRLALNQLAFLGLITVYCVWQMATISTEDVKAMFFSPETRAYSRELPMIDNIDRQIDQYGKLGVCLFYGLVIVLSTGFQGGMALYYYSRRKAVEAFVRRIPPWARQAVIQAAS